MTSAGYCEFFEHIILYHLTHFFQVSGALQTLIYPAALSGDGKTEILDLADIYRKDGCAGLEDYFLSLGH